MDRCVIHEEDRVTLAVFARVGELDEQLFHEFLDYHGIRVLPADYQVLKLLFIGGGDNLEGFLSYSLHHHAVANAVCLCIVMGAVIIDRILIN